MRCPDARTDPTQANKKGTLRGTLKGKPGAGQRKTLTRTQGQMAVDKSAAGAVGLALFLLRLVVFLTFVFSWLILGINYRG